MPEGSAEDDSDQDGGMPEEQDEDDTPKCPTPADMFRSRTESID